MRNFDYSKYKTCRWDNEILNYLARIHEYKGKQDLFLRQKPLASPLAQPLYPPLVKMKYISWLPEKLTFLRKRLRKYGIAHT